MMFRHVSEKRKSTLRSTFDLKTSVGRLNAMLTLMHLSRPAEIERLISSRAARIRLRARREQDGLRRLFGFARVSRKEIIRRHISLLRGTMWPLLPYGRWIEEAGSIVVFDREYCPILRIHPFRPPEILDPYERIAWVDQRWFYDQFNAPLFDPDILNRVEVLLYALHAEFEIRRRAEILGKYEEHRHRAMKKPKLESVY